MGKKSTLDMGFISTCEIKFATKKENQPIEPALTFLL
jgi:hypothetical protein